MGPVSWEEAETYLIDKGSARLQEQREHGVVNPIELARALNIRPQVIYNYVRRGALPSHLGPTQNIEILWQDAVEFIQHRLQKQATKQAKIREQLNGY